jgi:hypothetical protein
MNVFSALDKFGVEQFQLEANRAKLVLAKEIKIFIASSIRKRRVTSGEGVFAQVKTGAWRAHYTPLQTVQQYDPRSVDLP